MVVADLYIVGVAFYEPEADTPLIINRYRVLPFSIAMKGMKPIARRHLQVIELRSQVDVFKLASSPFGNARRQSPAFAGGI